MHKTEKETREQFIVRKLSRNKESRFLTCVRFVLLSFHSSHKDLNIFFFILWDSNAAKSVYGHVKVPKPLFVLVVVVHFHFSLCWGKLSPKIIVIAVQVCPVLQKRYKGFASNCRLDTVTRVSKLQTIYQCGQRLLFIAVDQVFQDRCNKGEKKKNRLELFRILRTFN